MITEDYCSYKVAKLLKEKGFDEPIFEFYVGNEDTIRYARNKDGFRLSELDGDFYYPHITLQMAMKWLREKHKIAINVRITCGKTISYAFDVWDFEIIHPNKFVGGTIDLREQQFGFKSYEEAVEAALKYVLENLI